MNDIHKLSIDNISKVLLTQKHAKTASERNLSKRQDVDSVAKEGLCKYKAAGAGSGSHNIVSVFY